MRNQEVKNKPQHNDHNKNDRKNRQEIATAFQMQQPKTQQNENLYPQGNRYIRSWVEGSPEDVK